MNRISIRSIFDLCCRNLKLLAQESGLALPIVLAVLALGAITIAPFLTHASTSLVSSQSYRQIINQNYSADAGIEQAIWNLTNGNLASQIPNVGNSTSYTLANQVNNIAPNITVTKIASGGAVGTITHSVIDTLQFNASGYTPKIINVSGNTYAVVCRDSSNRGALKTVAISSGGTITQTVIDTYTFDTTCYEPYIIRISSNVYVIAYRGASYIGYLATISIANNGIITKTLIDRKSYNSTSYEPDIINISGNTYAIAFRGSSNKGYITTVSVAANGSITNAAIDSYNFIGTCYEPDLSLVSGSVYVIACRGSSNRGYLNTVSIAASGTITKSVISNLTFNNSACYTPGILNVSGTTYAIVYRGPSSYGDITTVTIAANGTITSPVIDTFVFDGTAGSEPDIIPVSGSIFAIVYRGSSNDAYLKTISIAATGAINRTIVDTFAFDTTQGYEPNIIPVSGNTYAIAYRGNGNAGYLKTVGIVTSNTNTYQIQSVAGGTTTTATVVINNGLSTVISWVIDR